MKRTKLAELALDKVGGLMQAEVYGPPDIDMEIMLRSRVSGCSDARPIGSWWHLDVPHEDPGALCEVQRVTHLGTSADVRARYEHWSRTKLRLAHDMKTSPFEPSRPFLES